MISKGSLRLWRDLCEASAYLCMVCAENEAAVHVAGISLCLLCRDAM